MKLAAIKNKITGTNVKEYFDSKFALWCYFHAPASEKDQKSEYRELLAEKGRNYEDAVVEEHYPGLEIISVETTDDVFRELGKGADAFDNMTVFHENFIGKPDLLVKKKGKSKFGDFYYVVKEIKSAKNIKKPHIMQTAFYNCVLGQLQGYTPEKFYVINGEDVEFSYEFSRYAAKLQEALQEIAEIKEGKKIQPAIGTPYPWNSFAEKKALAEHDITIIQGISEKSRENFIAAGFTSITKVAKASEADLLEVKGVGKGIAAKTKHSAKAWLQKKPIILEKPKFKDVSVEMFFDLEATTPDEQLGVSEIRNYLFGLLVRNDKEVFNPFVATSLDNEEKVFRKFLQFINQFDDFVIYVYSSFEVQQLRRMCDEYKIGKEMQEKLFSHIVDVLKLVRRSVVFPTLSNSLKDVAKYLGFNWRHADVSGQESMAMYLKYLESHDEKILQKIIDYNEDDVVATKIIKDWLAEL